MNAESTPRPTDAPTRALAARLLSQIGAPPESVRLERLGGGANNQVFRVEADQHTYCLKRYCDNPRESREHPSEEESPRLRAEWSLLRHAQRCEADAAPRPLARDTAANGLLFEYIEGRRLTKGEPAERDVAAAAEFVERLNTHRPDDMPIAAEAGFSLSDHCRIVQRRVRALAHLDANSSLAERARCWAATQLAGEFERGVDRLRSAAAREGWGLDTEIPSSQRIVSPSDFGFHNALRRPDGRLVFLDFEYAGWDDPAKLACDFLLQPRVPAPEAHWEAFARRVLALRSVDIEAQWRRCRLLLPLYRVKWCCIVMKIFLREGAARARFHQSDADLRQLREERLETAARLLARELPS